MMPLDYPLESTKSLFSVVDVPAEFFLDTIARVFHDAALADGRLAWCGIRIAAEAITATALLTVEGEDDDISGLVQTQVARDLRSGIPAERRGHFRCPKVGHLCLIHGTSWRRDVLPRIDLFIQRNETIGFGTVKGPDRSARPG